MYELPEREMRHRRGRMRRGRHRFGRRKRGGFGSRGYSEPWYKRLWGLLMGGKGMSVVDNGIGGPLGQIGGATMARPLGQLGLAQQGSDWQQFQIQQGALQGIATSALQGMQNALGQIGSMPAPVMPEMPEFTEFPSLTEFVRLPEPTRPMWLSYNRATKSLQPQPEPGVAIKDAAVRPGRKIRIPE